MQMIEPDHGQEDGQEDHSQNNDHSDHSPGNDNSPENPPESPLHQSSGIPKGFYQTDTFFDRFAAHYSPKSVRLKPEILEETKEFDRRLQALSATVSHDYPDADIQARLSKYQKSEGKGILRVMEINDSEGAYYLPMIEAINGEPLQKAERFTKGEVRIVHQPVAQRISEDEMRIRHRVEAFFDQLSLEEAVEHMRDEMLLTGATETNYLREPGYSYLKEQMGEFILKGIGSLGSETVEQLMGEREDLTLNLLDLDTRPLPDGVVVRMTMIPDIPGRFLYFQYRVTLNTVGKLSIEDMGVELI